MVMRLPKKTGLDYKVSIERLIGQVLAFFDIKYNSKDEIINLIKKKGNITQNIPTKWGVLRLPNDLPWLLDVIETEEWDIASVNTEYHKYMNRKKLREEKNKKEEVIMNVSYLDITPILNEIKSHVYKNGNVTITSGNFHQTWDVEVKNNKITFGIEQPAHTLLFNSRLLTLLDENNYVVVVLRSFLDKIHEPTGLPFKELRGYIFLIENESVRIEQVELWNLIDSFNIHVETQLQLAPEWAVVYCDRNKQISSDPLIDSIKRSIAKQFSDYMVTNVVNEKTIKKLADLVFDLYEKFSVKVEKPDPDKFENELSKELQKLEHIKSPEQLSVHLKKQLFYGNRRNVRHDQDFE